jgi:hypothetical protein
VQKKAQFPVSTPQNSGSKTKQDPQKPGNSPQLTTKTEQMFYPQERGRSSAIDICFSRNTPFAFLVVILEGNLLLPFLLSSLCARP